MAVHKDVRMTTFSSGIFKNFPVEIRGILPPNDDRISFHHPLHVDVDDVALQLEDVGERSVGLHAQDLSRSVDPARDNVALTHAARLELCVE